MDKMIKYRFNNGHEGNPPPHANDAEINVLGAMLLSTEAVAKAMELLEPECFYFEKHAKIFTLMTDLFLKNIKADITSVATELNEQGLLESVGGTYYLTEILSKVFTAANVEYYARLVKEYHIRRQAIIVANESIEHFYDTNHDVFETLDKNQNCLLEIYRQLQSGQFLPPEKLASAFTEKWDKYQSGTLRAIQTGFEQIDTATGGFYGGDYVLVGARPSIGKTSLGLRLAINAMQEGIPVLFVSLEMNWYQIMLRLISMQRKIDLNTLRSFGVNAFCGEKMKSFIEEYRKSNLLIYAPPSINETMLYAKVKMLQKQYGTALVIIDYVQKIHCSKRAEKRYREIGIISGTINTIAKELDIPVVALVQLNREVERRAGGRPKLSDLRESGDMEQDADIVLLLDRPEKEDKKTFANDNAPCLGLADIILAKQRNGPIMYQRVSFLKEFSDFRQLEQRYEEPPLSGFDNYEEETF